MRNATLSAVLMCLSATLSFGATVIVSPPGLNSGDSYRLVFSVAYPNFKDATSTDIGEYDAFVTAAAEAVPELAALGATWQVIGSTATVNAIDHIGVTTVPIYRLDGLRVATSTADLWDGSIENAISISQNGTNQPYGVWTGTASNGYAVFPLGTPTAVYTGFPSFTDSSWIGAGPGVPVTYPNSFYAISSVLTFDPVPEPTTVSLLATGCTFLLIRARRRRT